LNGLDFTQILIGMGVLIASLSFHEAAHAWTADRLGDPTARLLGRLSLNPAVHVDPIGTLLFPLIAISTGVPLIGWAKPVPVNTRHLRSPKRDFAIIAAAGPVSNLVLAVVAALVLSVVPPEGLLGNALVFFVLLNVLLAVFNMVPVPPLDGGNVLMGVLPHEAAQVIERLRPYGFLLLYVLMLTGFLTWITRPVQSAILRWLL
jgi:Zn-dependent protease